MKWEEKIHLALVVHNHQPVGNKDEIIEKIYRASYLPFLKVLGAHPQVTVNLHYTGFLYDWLEKWHPEFIDLLQKLVDRNQVELVGGAYYEPVISVIPDSDALGQTALLSEKIQSMFGKKAEGFWTAERAWEPHLPEILSKAGATHTFIDDVGFQSAGLNESDCFQPYAVESRGNFVSVFPILKKLRYFIPFKSTSSTISFLKSALGQGIALYGDDGEKFGAWPSTFERVYKDRWLDSFFSEISKRNWIETVKVSEYLSKNPPRKRIYLPASAYSEMMDWAIPIFSGSESVRNRSVLKEVPRRGFWRLFFAKYPESARIYSKMLRVSNNINSIEGSRFPITFIDLWKGQCNDAYWHGVFGGLYAPILRKITYSNLIRAQVGYESVVHGASNQWLKIEDESRPGYQELNLDSSSLSLSVSPTLGGAICELDYKPCFVNVLDTLTRRPERYHSDVKKKSQKTIVPGKAKKKSVSIHDSSNSKEQNLDQLLIYDRYQKFAFVDYLVPLETGVESFIKQDFLEISSLAVCRYEPEIQKSNDSICIIQRSVSTGYKGEQIEMKKLVTFPSVEPKIRVDYELRFSNGQYGSMLFLPEINLGTLDDRKFVKNFSKSRVTKGGQIEVFYEEIGLKGSIMFPDSNSAWLIPVKTVSLSEEGFESNLQSVSILPNFEIEQMSEGGNFKTSIEVGFQSLGD